LSGGNLRDLHGIQPGGRNPESLLGSPDASSLVHVATAFEHVERMQLIPRDKKALLVLITAALIPMIPLLGTAIPLTEILAKLGEFLA
jgi:hypothetical protein